MFRDESSHVIKKAKARARKKANLTLEPGSSPDTPNSRLSLTPEPRGRPLSLVVPSPNGPISPAAESAWSCDDESNLLMSPNSDSWPATPRVEMLYNLTPSCQEQGIAYFFSRYVTIEQTACHHNFDFVYDVWKPPPAGPDREVDSVLASMTAVGLMGLASMTRSRDIMEAARKSYGTALHLINRALQSPAEAMEDKTMLSVLILGLFELINENTSRRRTVQAFRNHVNGAVALVKLRGTAQFQTRAGTRMFAMLCQRVMVCSINAKTPTPMPLALFELWQQMISNANTLDRPDDGMTWWILPLMYQILQVRSDIRTGSVTDPEAIVERLVGVEEEFEKIVGRFPPSWHYRIFKLTRNHPAITGGFCHVYPTLWHATVWNHIRAMRILVLETILSRISVMATGSPGHNRYIEEYSKAKRKLKQMVVSINASVPQMMGLVDPVDGSIEDGPTSIASVEVRETPSPPTSPSSGGSTSGESTKGNPGPRHPPTGLTILDPMMGEPSPIYPEGMPEQAIQQDDLAEEEEATRFVLVVSATSPVVWPLYVVGMSSVCTEQVKTYVIERLRALYSETGIRQADAVANLLDMDIQETIVVPNSPLVGAGDDEPNEGRAAEDGLRGWMAETTPILSPLISPYRNLNVVAERMTIPVRPAFRQERGNEKEMEESQLRQRQGQVLPRIPGYGGSLTVRGQTYDTPTLLV